MTTVWAGRSSSSDAVSEKAARSSSTSTGFSFLSASTIFSTPSKLSVTNSFSSASISSNSTSSNSTSSPSTVTLIGLPFDAAGVAVLFAEVGAELLLIGLSLFSSASNAALRAANSALVKIFGRSFGATDFTGAFLAGAFATDLTGAFFAGAFEAVFATDLTGVFLAGVFAPDLTGAFFAGALATVFAADLTAAFFAGAAFLAGLEDGT